MCYLYTAELKKYISYPYAFPSKSTYTTFEKGTMK